MRRHAFVIALLAAVAVPAAAPAASGPEPGSPAFVQRDFQNMADAYGRQVAPGGQLRDPNYLATLFTAGTAIGLDQLGEQLAHANRPALTPGNVAPGWNTGNPHRAGWTGRRGRRVAVQWTNRLGALVRGDVYAPLRGARDPYTRRRLKGPYPSVVITEGSVQGSEGMYRWLAEDLAERGYVVLLYDVQGQGRSETIPHENGRFPDLPFCWPGKQPSGAEETGCDGVPAQQEANFYKGAQNAITFMLAKPAKPYPNPHAGSTRVNRFNPLWKLIDRRRFAKPRTKGRRIKLAIVGHSLGAIAVSHLQQKDRRVATVIALDKLTATDEGGFSSISAYPTAKPVVPALAVQSEYGFQVNPYVMSGCSSISPCPIPPTQAPDPQREIKVGFGAWRKARKDAMLIVPRASTHLEYTDIPLVLPASRYGQDLTSVYAQQWLAKYLKRQRSADRRLRAGSFRYLEPRGNHRWVPVALKRRPLFSYQYCSAWSFKLANGRRTSARDLSGAGCR
jgi:dienelactone hydrolase